MDALSDVLRVVHLTGGVFLHAEFFAPWCIAVRVAPEDCAPLLGPASHLILYHYVVEGELHGGVEGEEAFVLRPGEVVLFPRNDQHRLGSDLALPAGAGQRHYPAPQGWRAVLYPPQAAAAPVPAWCVGFWAATAPMGNPVIATLPAALRLTIEEGGAAVWMRSTFQYAAKEVAAGRPGSATVLAKLSELLLWKPSGAMQKTLPEGQTGWLAGLRDPYVARALALLHRDMTRSWTVDRAGPPRWAVPLSARRALHAPDRCRPDALPRHLAHAGRGARAAEPQHLPRPGRGTWSATSPRPPFHARSKKAFGTAPATWRRLRSQTA